MKTRDKHIVLRLCALVSVSCLTVAGNGKDAEWVPPSLPNGKTVVTSRSEASVTMPDFVKPNPEMGSFTVAREPSTVDFLYLPGQVHGGRTWSCWGDGCFAGGKYYTSIGDHEWVSMVYEYDPAATNVRMLVNVKEFLNLPAGHYTPGKIHTDLGMGKDGWLYYATHNGAGASEQYHYKGDWLLRTHPGTGKTEVVSRAPVGARSIPAGVLDADRMIYYGGSEQDLVFFAYDLEKRKVMYESPPLQGPSRCILHSTTTGRAYYRGDIANSFKGRLRRYDPADNSVKIIESGLDPRSAARETPEGIIYAADWDGRLWALDVKTEKTEIVGTLTLIKNTYITSLAIDPSGRYIYYCPGAHGEAAAEGTPVIQFDTSKKAKKVIAFLTRLAPEFGYECIGTYNTALSEDGSKLYVTWNGNRTGRPPWDVCAMTAIHIPESERVP